MSRVLLAVAFLGSVTFQAQATSLKQAVHWAVETNPRIEAAQANQRASGFALEQARGRLFPEISIEADGGIQNINRPEGLAPAINNNKLTRRRATISIRQVLFDGFDRANDIYASQARIASASGRVLARAESVGLSAVEAYIDVRRHLVLLGLARENVKRHHMLLKLIQDRIEGGARASKRPGADK